MVRRILACIGLLALAVLLPTCGKQYALLLTVRAQQSSTPPSVYDLRVKNLATSEEVLARVGEKVDPDNPNRDISQSGQELKIAIEFGEEGNYLVYIWARGGQGMDGSQFFLRDFQVDDVIEKEVMLSPLSGDSDGDGFPACGASGVQCGPTNCKYLDCDDTEISINPFAVEMCENGRDDDCSAGCGAAPPAGDAKCVDNDGDLKPAGEDCDDSDPCRSPAIKEARNLCKIGLAEWDIPETKACKDKLAKEGKTFAPPFCSDGIDQDCNGQDVDCFPDDDCDQFKPPEDCNDKDPKVNPQAAEICGDNKDNNCNGQVDEGCLPCDVDGDQHARVGYTGGNCQYPPDDTDDYDAGVHPGTTVKDGGKEGGTVLGGLREYCSSTRLEKNGKKPMREVDHDGDTKTAAEDGCPTTTCDVDGDGFEGAQCSPSPSLKDCKDDDPHIFPGAPDLCGDGIAQNCVQDGSCSCDNDKDKYCAPADCDDNNPNVHPWATEKCDRVDNDCDSLIDEGNPDHTGALIPVDVPLCNDDNDGVCAEPAKNGKCACSPVDTTKVYIHDPQNNRLRCNGENLAAPASPRCFEAVQRSKEQCDNKDWNCDGLPFNSPADITNNDFVDLGMACGLSKGTCNAGTVSDCNLSQMLLAQQLSVLGSGYNQHWVCTDPTTKQAVKLPSAELCNGFDDDCNDTAAGWPEVAEKDADGDGWLTCNPCSNPVASWVKGCGDCNDNAIGGGVIFPGQFEKCDTVDNNCTGNGDEGTGECTGTWSCCPLPQNACRQKATDTQNCGTCGKTCNIAPLSTATEDSCVGGNCRCGGSAPCTGSRNCKDGSCQCIQNGLCSGCCDGNTCRAGNTTQYCGTNGESCDGCTAPVCQTPACSSGNCTTNNVANGTPCQGTGQCYNGSCCSICWQSGTCQSSSTTAHCGTGGGQCAVCASGQACVGGNCVCTSSSCSGCCDGNTCRAGTSTTYCGTGGAPCTGCGSGQTCPSGSCICTTSSCSGCCDGNTCRAGTSTTYCGTGGEPCTGCAGGQACPSGSCVCNSSSCSSGCCEGTTCHSPSTSFCGTGGEPCDTCVSGQTCSGGNCVCNASSCPSGCCSGTTCQPGNTSTYCGTGGETCDTCVSGQTCSGGNCICTAGSCPSGCCDGSNCRAGNTDQYCGTGGETCDSCAAGQDCSGGNCVCNTTTGCSGCCSGNSCLGGTSNTACGSGGATCEDCVNPPPPAGQTCQSQACAP